MADLPTLAVGDSVAPNEWQSAPNGALTLIGAGDQDSNFGYKNDNSAETDFPHVQGWALADMPEDFESMDTLAIQLRYAWSAFNGGTKTWPRLSARVMDGSTVLAAANAGGDFENVATDIETTTPTNSAVVSFTFVNTGATKAQWDAAVVEILISHTRIKGGNSNEQRVFASSVTGTYTTAGVDATVSGVTATVDASALAGNVTAVEFPTVYLADADDFETATKVEQTVTGYTPDTEIVFTAVQGALSDGTAYVFVENSAGLVNEAGFAVTLGTAGVSATITGVSATATAAALPGTVATAQGSTISGALATADAAALPGTVETPTIATISGQPATATAAALVGTVAAVRSVTISGAVATADAAALPGTVASQEVATVTGVVATADSAALPGTVNTGAVVTIAGELATATAAALPGTVAAERNVTITGAVATADAAALPGEVSTVVPATVSGEPATASAAALAGTVAAVEIVTVSGESATASAAALPGEVATGAVVTVAGVPATATAVAIAGTVATEQVVTVSGALATSDAAAIAGTVETGDVATISGAVAAAGASAVAGVVSTEQLPFIVAVLPDTFNEDDLVDILGSNFGAIAGRVVLSPTDNVDDPDAVDQTVTAWADDEITFTVVR